MAMTVPVAGSEPRPGPVLFLYFHASKADTVRSSVIFASASGELKASGVESEVVEIFLEERDEAASAAAMGELQALLMLRRPSVVVLDEVPHRDIFSQIRDVTGARVLLGSPYTNFVAGTVDYVVHHFDTNPVAFVAIVRRILGGGDAAELPNVAIPQADRVPAPASGAEAFAPAGHQDALPDVERTFLPAGFLPEPFRVTFYRNPGCPYGEEARENPFFEGVAFPAGHANTRGCAFCPMGGDYHGAARTDTVAQIVRELHAYRARWPTVREVILRDQSPHRYLLELVRAIQAEGLEPMSIMVSTRADFLPHFERTFEAVCEACEGSDVELNVYLIGAENFAGPELQRLNKGYGPETLARALGVCRELANRYPKSFVYDRYPTWSFILFGPWTTLDDLRDNVAAFRKNDILECSTWMGRTKLRLYANQALFYKARADGLLVDSYDDEGLDSARVFGYAVEFPWRFSDPRVEQVYQIFSRTFEAVDPALQVALLGWVVERVAGAGAPLDVERVADGLLALTRLERLLDPAAPGGAGSAPGPGPHVGGAGAAEDAPTIPTELVAKSLQLGAACNNGCSPCMRDRALFEMSPDRLQVRLAELAAVSSRLVIQGREPTMTPTFLEALREARALGFEQVECLSNGRMFAYRGFREQAVAAGLTRVGVKLFAADAESYAARTRAPGSFESHVRGLRNLTRRDAGLEAYAVVVVRPDTLGDLRAIHDFAREHGSHRPTYRVSLTALAGADLERIATTLALHLTELRERGEPFNYGGLL